MRFISRLYKELLQPNTTSNKRPECYVMQGSNKPNSVNLLMFFQQSLAAESVQFSSVTQLCPTLCDPMNHSMTGLPVHHQLPEFIMSIESVMPSNHLILCRLLILPPSVFPSIRVCSNESAFRISWPKYWSFTFNISPSNEH